VPLGLNRQAGGGKKRKKGNPVKIFVAFSSLVIVEWVFKQDVVYLFDESGRVPFLESFYYVSAGKVNNAWGFIVAP
jgi:hypothetical protein